MRCRAPPPVRSLRRRAAGRTRCAAVAGAVLAGAGASAEAASLDAVKAGFVFNFTKFVSWPAREDEAGQVRLCFERGSISPEAYRELDGKTVRGTTVHTRTVKGAAGELGACDLAVFAAGTPPAASVRRAADRNGVLLIGNGLGFARGGGHIALMRRGDKLRFRVNLRALRRAGLEVRSGLLRLAEEVIRTGDG